MIPAREEVARAIEMWDTCAVEDDMWALLADVAAQARAAEAERWRQALTGDEVVGALHAAAIARLAEMPPVDHTLPLENRQALRVAKERAALRSGLSIAADLIGGKG